jgi:hypothetical protein
MRWRETIFLSNEEKNQKQMRREILNTLLKREQVSKRTISESSDTVESEGRQIKQCCMMYILYIKIPLF